MSWCPKCGTEYEEGVQSCVDCHIDLVDNEEDIVDWAILLKVKTEEEVKKILEYLDYSNIKKVKSEKDESEGYFTLYIPSEKLEEARKFMRVYLSHELEREDVEYLINEYETEEPNEDRKMDDLKSSASTFTIVGLIAIVFSILNAMEIINLPGFNKYLLSGVIGILGIAFVIIGISSFTKLKDYRQASDTQESKIMEIINWYTSQYNIEDLYKKYNIDIDEIDEGALYFIIIDQLKADIVKQFPQAENKIINTAAEKIYDQMSNTM